MVQSDKIEAIPVWPLSMKCEVDTFTDKSRNDLNVIHFIEECDITIEDIAGATKTFTFKEGCDVALSPEIVKFTTTGQVMVG